VNHVPTNIRWHHAQVTAADRERSKGQRGAALWFTGLSGAGKSTIAALVDARLVQLGRHSYILDGDNLRFGLCNDLDFSPEDRAENTRRLAEVAALFVDAGLIVLVAAISPYRRDRDHARTRLPPGRFVEVFVDTDLAECERRDPKGLYRKARAGEITGFSGIDAPYERPEAPELRLIAGASEPEALADQVLAQLAELGFLRCDPA
jgi:adenylyl-sulfate kinase